MLPLKLQNSSKQYETPFYNCHQYEAEFIGFSKTYFVVNFRRTAAVICLNSNNEVLLTRQYRFLINRISLEIAGGGIGEDEDFAVGAARELLEETGFEANELIPLCKFRPGLDNVDNPTEIFLCRSFIKKFDISPNPSEILGIEWVHIDTCLELISSYEIQDGTSVMGIALAKAYLAKVTEL